MIRNEVNVSAMGGTELLGSRLYNTANKELKSLLDQCQIWFSRYRPEDVDNTKWQIFYAHDLPADPESQFLANGGWQKFHKIVFVSNWQMQQYVAYYDIPYSHCLVIANSIEPIDNIDKPTDKISIGYWSTPHRGLELLIPAFEFLAQKHDNIELDVFSSFKLYGWEQRDEQYKELFDKCNAHSKINYHGTVSNDEIRKYVAKAHIFAYPSIWLETSCLCLIEAMSAKLLAVHPNLGALFETSANWTMQYQFHEDKQSHANLFANNLDAAIQRYWEPGIQGRLSSAKAYADVFYNSTIRQQDWFNLLTWIVTQPLIERETFTYRVG
jgi:glycosyltransferase involved in cell wall biosynthesis